MACAPLFPKPLIIEEIPSPPYLPMDRLDFFDDPNPPFCEEAVKKEGLFSTGLHIIYTEESSEVITYTLKKNLGKGSTGTSFFILKKTISPLKEEIDQYCVMKVLKHKHHFKREVERLKIITPHDNIIKYIDAFSVNKVSHLILLKYGGQNLLNCCNQSQFSLKKVAHLTKQILEGVAHLHKQHWMHLDLKPENILLSAEKITIIDFDGAEFGENYKLQDGELRMTSYYRPPEHDGERVLYPKSDVWSVAYIVYILITHKHLFTSNEEINSLAWRTDIFMQIFSALGSASTSLSKTAIMQERRAAGLNPIDISEPHPPNRKWEKTVFHPGWAGFLTSLFQYLPTRPSSEEALALLSKIELDDAPIVPESASAASG